MEMVNVQCGHCGSLMAVEGAYLGQQVRCPHCREVVLAPQTNARPGGDAPPATPHELNLALSRAVEEHESIFTQPEPDDLFDEPSQPFVLPPRAPSALPPPLPETFIQAPVERPEPPRPPDPVTERLVPAAYENGSQANAPMPASNAPEPLAPPPIATPPPPYRSRGSSLFTAYLLIILIPYAVFMTVVAVLLYYRAESRQHPLEYLPDNIGNHPGVTRKGSRMQTYQRPPVDLELPKYLHVPLGQALRLGSLEVMPISVEEGPLLFAYRDGRQGGQSTADALILHLRLTNTSTDQVFYPTDPSFNRWWKPGQGDETKPYSFLEVGAVKRFYGGPFQWPSRERGPAAEDNLYVAGQDDDHEPLGPGQTRTTVICTDPKDNVAAFVQEHSQEPLVWRVHLRRGLEAVAGRDVSATAVIGVEFTAADIKQLPP